jgi:hypothetical protein
MWGKFCLFVHNSFVGKILRMLLITGGWKFIYFGEFLALARALITLRKRWLVVHPLVECRVRLNVCYAHLNYRIIDSNLLPLSYHATKSNNQ